MSDPVKERTAIASAYPNSARWQEKVKKMSDAQVIAVYKRLLAEGKLR